MPPTGDGAMCGGAKPLSRSRSRPSGVIRSLVQGGSKLSRTETSSASPSAPTRSVICSCMTPMAGQPTNVGSSSTST